MSRNREKLRNSNERRSNSKQKREKRACRKWIVRDKRKSPQLSQKSLNVKKTLVF